MSSRHRGYLDTRELALRYGKNADTARRWCRNRWIPSIKIGRDYLVRESDLAQFEAEHATAIHMAGSGLGRPMSAALPSPGAPVPFARPIRRCPCGELAMPEHEAIDCTLPVEPRLRGHGL